MAEQKAMYIIDEEHRILYMNAACRAYYPEVKLHEKCYHALAQGSGICQNCPMFQETRENTFYNARTQEWVHAQAISVELESKQQAYAIVFELLRNEQQADASAMGIKSRVVHRQNLELEYIKHRRPDAFHSCRDEKGFPFREISQPFCQLLGYTREEIEAQFQNMLLNMVVPEDRMKLLYVHKMEEIGTTMQLQYRICTKSRGVIWVKGTVRLSEFSVERFYQATVVEITDEIKRQQELKQKNRELELILSAIPGGLKHIEADEHYSFRFLSEEAAALFGYTVDELELLTTPCFQEKNST